MSSERSWVDQYVAAMAPVAYQLGHAFTIKLDEALAAMQGLEATVIDRQNEWTQANERAQEIVARMIDDYPYLAERDREELVMIAQYALRQPDPTPGTREEAGDE